MSPNIAFKLSSERLERGQVLGRELGIGNPLWLMVLLKKHISKCSEVPKKYLGVHLEILCSVRNFTRKRYFLVACLEKTISMLQIAIYVTFFVFLYKPPKISFVQVYPQEF
jgi:hypothetical protein